MKVSPVRALYASAIVMVALLGVVGLAFAATYYYLKPTLPDVAQIRDLKLQMPLRIYTRDGRLVSQIGDQRRLPVRFEEVPQVVVQAFLAAEDDRFFEHPGIDWQGMVRAVLVVAGLPGPRQGGSTLTQQLVRTTLIENERTMRRKLREIFLALTLEHELSKQEILELYLNTVFLGQRAYGVAAAAETYFGKRLGDIDIAEAALLAGIPQRPSRYNPVASRELAERRRAYVLRRMNELNFIDDAEREAALAEPITGELFGPRVEVDAPYAAELVRQALFEQFGERIYTDGLQVTTTLDSRMQVAADIALRSAVLEYDRRHGYRGPAAQVELPPVEGPDVVEAALAPHPVVGPLLPALVLAVDGRGARVATRSRGAYELSFDGMQWAAKALPNGATGPAPARPADVVARGDVVYILPNRGRAALLAQIPAVQGALAALDPHDGAIVALSGGFDFYSAKFNRATQARRQPGSAFKPFVYSAALEGGLTPASIILDAPVVYEAPTLDPLADDPVDAAPEDGEQQPEERDWRPQNVDSRFYGPTRLRDALARSRNLVSIRVMRSLGIGFVRDYTTRFGFPPEHIPADLTAALGTAQLTPLEVARGYAVFANGGHLVEPYLIDRVTDAAGEVLVQAEPRIACPECDDGGIRTAAPGPAAAARATWAADVNGRLLVPEAQRAPEVISPANAFIMTDMMRDVVERGTGRRALALGRKDVVGKTGTTNDRRDAWFAGFNADLVAATWVGFDQERSLGPREEGGRTALPMWVYFMREALAGRAEHRLAMPEGVVTARVSALTGEAASIDDPDAVFEYFLPGTAPTRERDADNPFGPGAGDGLRSEEPLF